MYPQTSKVQPLRGVAVFCERCISSGINNGDTSYIIVPATNGPTDIKKKKKINISGRAPSATFSFYLYL